MYIRLLISFIYKFINLYDTTVEDEVPGMCWRLNSL